MPPTQHFKRKYSRNKFSHRRLSMSPHFIDPQRGDDVKELQRAVNQRLKFIGEEGKLKVDGLVGRSTVGRARHVARALGIGLRGPGVSIYVQHLLRHPVLRTPAQKARGKAWRKENITPPAKVDGNTVTGGKNLREKIVSAAMEASHLYYTGQSHRYYSQPGAWTVDHGITGETQGRDRSDCSQFVTAMFHSAGAPDPNGQNYGGGYTGTLEANGKEISQGEAKPGDIILYGPHGATHHVELLVGPGTRTVGHGSPPVDYGDVFMLAGARFFRCPGVD